MIRYYTKQHGELIELTDYAVHCWINIEPPFSHEELEDLSSKLNIPLDFFTDPLDNSFCKFWNKTFIALFPVSRN